MSDHGNEGVVVPSCLFDFAADGCLVGVLPDDVEGEYSQAARGSATDPKRDENPSIDPSQTRRRKMNRFTSNIQQLTCHMRFPYLAGEMAGSSGECARNLQPLGIVDPVSPAATTLIQPAYP
jgi:hypothetical protein